MEYQDFYERLGLDRNATPEEIKRAYRKLARRYHPDVSDEADAEARFKDVQEAYDVLGDEEKRRAYDELGNSWQQGQPFEPPPDWQDAFTAADGQRFSDIFDELFGGGRGSSFRNTQHVNLALTLEEAMRGGRFTVHIRKMNADKSGRMRVTETPLEINVPAGVTDGDQLHARTGDGIDVGIGIRLVPHPRFRVQGHDLYTDVHVPAWDAALGGTVNVKTVDGSVNLKIPAGSKSGQKLRVKGKGLKGRRHGDLYAHLQVTAAAPKNDAQRAAWQALRDSYAMREKA